MAVSSAVVARRGVLSVRAYPLVGVLAAACLGVELDHRLGISPLLWVAFLASTIVVWFVLRRCGHDCASAWLVLVAAVALAGAWHHDRWYLFRDDNIVRYARAHQATSICLLANAMGAPSFRPAAEPSPLSTVHRGPSSQVLVRARAIRGRAGWQPVSGRVMLLVQGRLPPLAHGDRLRIVGDLFRTRAPQNPGVPDYAALARGRRCLCLVVCRQPECVSVCARGTRANPLSWPGRLRVWAHGMLARHVGPRRAPLAAALILGTRRELDDPTFATFFTSGTLHLLAISGLHVGILASLLWFLLRLDGWARPTLLWLTFGMVMTYAAVTGMRSPVLRASVLVAAYCVARSAGRRGTAWNFLAAAGLVTLILQPTALRQPGTQLSFLAVATIIRAWPWLTNAEKPDPLDRLIARTRPLPVRVGRAVAERTGRALALSAIVWLVTAPLVAIHFHLLAPVAIALNLLLWGPVVVAMFSGILTILLGPVVPILASGTGTVCAGALDVTYSIAHWCATWPIGHWYTSGPPWWWLALGYIGLAVGTAAHWRLVRHWRWRLLVAWLCVGLATTSVYARLWHSIYPRHLQVTFVAVGHGVCVLIELPDGRNIIYDAGRMGRCEAAAAPICGVLWSRHIGHIDGLVLSHADVDHFNAVPALLERFSVGAVYVSPVMFRHATPAAELLRDAIAAAHVPLREVSETDRLDVGPGVRIDVLHPPPDGCGVADNPNSIVLLLTCCGRRVLLTGDLEGAGLDELLAEEACHCDVILAPHHGSMNSQPRRVVAWSTPAWVIVSDAPSRAGARASGSGYNGADHVVHLGYTGACRFTIESERIDVKLEMKNKK